MGETEGLILLFLEECFNCRWVGSGFMRQKFLYVGPAENVSVFVAIFKKISLGRSWSVRGAIT